MYTYFLIPIFYLLYQLLWGYYCQFFILVALYPDISFLTFFGVHFRLAHTLCFIFFLLFSGRVPRHFILGFFRGTFSSCSYIMFHIFLAFWWLCTSLFHFLLFSGYIFVLLIHYVSYFSYFLAVAYPDISFLTFFGVHFRLAHTLCFIFSLFFSGCVPRYFILCFFRGTRLLVHHLLWLQHTPLCPKRTPIFNFSLFSGYAPSRTSLIMSSAHSSLPETYPDISLLPFLGVQPSTTPSTLFHPPHTKAYSGGVSPQSMLSLASLAFPIVFRQPEAHLVPLLIQLYLSFVSDSIPPTGSTSRSTTYSIIFVFRSQ